VGAAVIAWWWLPIAVVVAVQLYYRIGRLIIKRLPNSKFGGQTMRQLDHDTLIALDAKVRDELVRRRLELRSPRDTT
jgi:hypothetical protein